MGRKRLEGIGMQNNGLQKMIETEDDCEIGQKRTNDKYDNFKIVKKNSRFWLTAIRRVHDQHLHHPPVHLF